jgi:hypothetical protein
MMRYFLSLLLCCTLSLYNYAQAPFSVSVEPFQVEGFQGAQSFVVASHDDHILVIGGRSDGLHRRQPFASFLPEGNNTLIQLVQPQMGAYYQANVATLPEPLQEQLQSTNMEFYQDGDRLYIIGGYGYSASMGDHITFAQLTVVDVPMLVQSLINGADISPAFRYLPDARMEVTGGYLQMMQDTFYLVGGQRFTGRYNPHNGPSFVQEYTNQVRRFTIEDEGDGLSIGFYETWTDEMHLHRRDYNLVPQVYPGGEVGLTAFSGVFQHAVDLPFLNSVDITPAGYAVNNDFEQYLNHYHCGTAPLYEAEANAMHTLFFGGMSQFYLDETGSLQEDQEVPFVPTIGCVSRYADGSIQENRVGVLPALLGSGAEFVAVGPVSSYSSDIQALEMPEAGDSLFLGYLLGGIESSAPNIFFVNTGVESIASNSLFRVYLKGPVASAAQELDSQAALEGLSIAPNPVTDKLLLRFNLWQAGMVNATLVDAQGKIIRQWPLGLFPKGKHQLEVATDSLPAGQYWINIAAQQSQQALPFVKY